MQTVLFGSRGNLLNLEQKCCVLKKNFFKRRLDGYLMSKTVITLLPKAVMLKANP